MQVQRATPAPSGTRLGLRRSKSLFCIRSQRVKIGTGLAQDRGGSIPRGTASSVDLEPPDRCGDEAPR